MRLDCLLLHVPKFQNRYPSLGNYSSLLWMALGMFALADAVTRAGHSARILHLGIEKERDPAFTMARYLGANPVRVAALSVHFHQQLYDSLRTAAAIKSHDPSIHVVLGGLTATFFAEDILREHPYIDSVITGEGERPLAELVGALKSGASLDGVPNLLRRENGEIKRSATEYLATQADIDALDFANFTYLEHYRDYAAMPKIYTRLRMPQRLRWRASKIISQRARRIFFALPVGRGCVTNCLYCGGGSNAHRTLNRRPRPIFRSPEKVLETIRQLQGYGYHGARVSFDPLPDSDAYFRELFVAMRREKLQFDFIFAAWSLPSPEFVEEFSRTFDRHSLIAISPETGSDTLRRGVRGIYFSNEKLVETLALCERLGVRSEIYFSLGLARESREDFRETLALKVRIEREFKLSAATAFPIEIEPAAPWYLDPDKYGITVVRRTLADFLREQADPSYSSMVSLGYYQDTYLGEPVTGAADYARKVQETKCRYFCGRRALCRTASAVWGAADRLGLSASGDVAV